MTATTTSASSATSEIAVVAAPTASRRLLVPGLVAGAVASAATTATVLVAHALGEDVAIAGEQIPVAGFAQFVMVGALLGVVLAKVLARKATHPRSAFVRTTIGLTALSIVPDLVVDATTGAKLVLALTHVIAAATIIPVLAARMPESA
jgi:hypothetical protein